MDMFMCLFFQSNNDCVDISFYTENILRTKSIYYVLK